ncbi:MAG: DinB family protein [bacterium]
MTETFLTKLFEHNHWANLRIIAACSALTDEQLDAAPQAGSSWSIRHTLTHIVEAQRGYLSLLTLPPEARRAAPLAFAELRESAARSGEGLLALARDETRRTFEPRLRTTDGYLVEPWVVMVQIINHASEHRRQICGMLRAIGAPAPDLDGWTFAESVGALVRIAK